MPKLLATSGTEKGILQCVCAYWCSPPEAYSLKDGILYSESKQAPVEGHTVIIKNNRYRFERTKQP